jgi:hypothetical protein
MKVTLDLSPQMRPAVFSVKVKQYRRNPAMLLKDVCREYISRKNLTPASQKENQKIIITLTVVQDNDVYKMLIGLINKYHKYARGNPRDFGGLRTHLLNWIVNTNISIQGSAATHPPYEVSLEMSLEIREYLQNCIDTAPSKKKSGRVAPDNTVQKGRGMAWIEIETTNAFDQPGEMQVTPPTGDPENTPADNGYPSGVDMGQQLVQNSLYERESENLPPQDNTKSSPSTTRGGEIGRYLAALPNTLDSFSGLAEESTTDTLPIDHQDQAGLPFLGSGSESRTSIKRYHQDHDGLPSPDSNKGYESGSESDSSITSKTRMAARIIKRDQRTRRTNPKAYAERRQTMKSSRLTGERGEHLERRLISAGFSRVQILVFGFFNHMVVPEEAIDQLNKRELGLPQENSQEYQQQLQMYQSEIVRSIVTFRHQEGLVNQHHFNSLLNTPNDESEYGSSDAVYQALKSRLDPLILNENVANIIAILAETQSAYGQVKSALADYLKSLSHNGKKPLLRQKDKTKICLGVTQKLFNFFGTTPRFEIASSKVILDNLKQRIEHCLRDKSEMSRLLEAEIARSRRICQLFFTREEVDLEAQMARNILDLTRLNTNLESQGKEGGICLASGLLIALKLDERIWNDSDDNKQTYFQGVYEQAIPLQSMYEMEFSLDTSKSGVVFIPDRFTKDQGYDKADFCLDNLVHWPILPGEDAIGFMKKYFEKPLQKCAIVAVAVKGHIFYMKLMPINNIIHLAFIDPMNAGVWAIPTTATQKEEFSFEKIVTDNPEFFLKMLMKKARLGDMKLMGFALLNKGAINLDLENDFGDIEFLSMHASHASQMVSAA